MCERKKKRTGKGKREKNSFVAPTYICEIINPVGFVSWHLALQSPDPSSSSILSFEPFHNNTLRSDERMAQQTLEKKASFSQTRSICQIDPVDSDRRVCSGFTLRLRSGEGRRPGAPARVGAHTAHRVRRTRIRPGSVANAAWLPLADDPTCRPRLPPSRL
jgi:hypothetical protein